MKTARFLVLIVGLFLLPASVLGQTAATARISGLVTDANGAAVAGASVKLVDKTTRAERIDKIHVPTKITSTNAATLLFFDQTH